MKLTIFTISVAVILGAMTVCQWRRGLKLSGETAVEKITLDGVRGLRVMLSATVHDVLYYMSPIYCQDIINSVSNQLNRLYLKFLKRNPGYDGMVSLYGHSLGSVLAYDILCHQENLSSPFPMDWMYKEHSWNEESPVNMNAYSSIRNSSVADETMGTLVSIDESKTAKPTLLVHEEDHAEDSCVADPVTLDSDEFSSRTTDSNQLNAKIDVHESVCNFSDVFPQVKDGLDEAASINYGVSVAGSEVHEDTSDKEKVINSLKKEIDFLKARITELKLQTSEENTSGGGNKQPMKPISDKLPLGQEDTHVNYTPYIKYTKLEFKVDTFFAVGSPLGVFLALRNVRIGIGKGQEYWGEENITEEMPACRQMFNIFHPFDPVAYRIEPLVCKEYISKRPVIIPYYKGGKRLHIGIQDFAEDLASRSQAIMDHLSVVRAKVLTVCQSRHSDSEEAPEISQDKEERTYGSIMMERLTGSKDGRVDHMLQDKTFEHAYISAIGAHTNYWRDYDTALFILKHLYRHIPEEPYTGREFDGNISKNESDSTGWGEERGAIDEELPLTFSDKVTRKSFSKKEKKIVKKP